MKRLYVFLVAVLLSIYLSGCTGVPIPIPREDIYRYSHWDCSSQFGCYAYHTGSTPQG